ncbi:ATP-binding protein [Gudongella oleilytica]|uniref:ATP-binding protein n=1 Tax=Gudongella oleilytica TaxID=1582259 RepID=UPI002A35F395|nr:ATP-binding protein [Gudongella oleilytica]MDY0256330.1 ATP-binding protein [Gudongella oleilytica]
MDYIYKGSVCSDLDTIKSFIDKTVQILNGIISDRDLMFDIRVILNELIVNGALHGNECMSSKTVSLTLRMSEDKLMIEVEDEGRGINYNLKEYNPSDLKSWGRGLVLVNGLSDELYVDRNRVVSIKRIV